MNRPHGFLPHLLAGLLGSACGVLLALACVSRPRPLQPHTWIVEVAGHAGGRSHVEISMEPVRVVRGPWGEQLVLQAEVTQTLAKEVELSGVVKIVGPHGHVFDAAQVDVADVAREGSQRYELATPTGLADGIYSVEFRVKARSKTEDRDGADEALEFFRVREQQVELISRENYDRLSGVMNSIEDEEAL